MPLIPFAYQKKQRKMIILLIIIILLTLIVLYFGFGKSAWPPWSAFTPFPSVIDTEPKIEIETDLFEDPRYKALKFYEEESTTTIETGRENPFEPY